MSKKKRFQNKNKILVQLIFGMMRFFPQDPNQKPRVVHRGLEGLPEIPDGEVPDAVDHLVFHRAERGRGRRRGRQPPEPYHVRAHHVRRAGGRREEQVKAGAVKMSVLSCQRENLFPPVFSQR